MFESFAMCGSESSRELIGYFSPGLKPYREVRGGCTAEAVPLLQTFGRLLARINRKTIISVDIPMNLR
jgi:hypothetical protein